MKTISKFDELDDLPIPSDIRVKLKQHMIEPFDNSEAATSSFWDEVGTSLILIEETDTDDTIKAESESVQHLTRFCTNYPEFVLLINSEECNYILAVAIVTSEGGGVYITAPTSNESHPVKTLFPQAECI
ncbi:hypothetical protein [Vibrio splendidus]|uniref:hypothetical protein n=1 Tax=Vibrio splendidus TaxID=29497 RepID=UPI000D3B1E6B|nr:hypothetical protein [Vibrio splendidus]PTP27528.1 hypothetical protein CWN95_23560 [Vibrio splendidus]